MHIARTRIEQASPQAGRNDGAPLPLGTFRDAPPRASDVRADIDCCELGMVARALGATTIQTVRLFCWATRATAQLDITPSSIDTFADVLAHVGARFGTHAAHFALSVDEATAHAQASGAEPRDHTTIARHVNRLPALRDHHLALFERRIRPGCRLMPDANEIARVRGWPQHRFFVLVERNGTIQDGLALDAFEAIAGSKGPSATWAPRLVDHARQALSRSPAAGRACVVSRHGVALRPIPGFWAAALARTSNTYQSED